MGKAITFDGPVIRTTDLRKTFTSRRSTVEAVRGVDLEVRAGEIFGFLGPNGAGKTTTLRMLATLIRPTAGEVWVAGVDLLRDPAEVRRRIGYVPQGGRPTRPRRDAASSSCRGACTACRQERRRLGPRRSSRCSSSCRPPTAPSRRTRAV